MEAPPRFLAAELAEAFRRTPSARLDEDFPQVLPCFRVMLPDGVLFTADKVPMPVVIVADRRPMADWLPPEAQRIGGISCVGLALNGTSATQTAIPSSRSVSATPPLITSAIWSCSGTSRRCRAPTSA